MGALDFSKRGVDQLLREKWVLNELENRHYSDLSKIVHDWHMAGAWNDASNFDFHFSRVRSLYAEIGKKTLPWLDDWRKMSIPDLHEIWARFLEDGKRPEVKANIKRMHNWMREQIGKDVQEAEYWSVVAERIRNRQEKENLRRAGRTKSHSFSV